MQIADSGRLRFLTSQFEALQGLRMVPIGAWFFATHWLHPGHEIIEVLLILPCIFAASRARAYYERRFGYVNVSGPQWWHMMLFFGLLLLAWYVARRFQLDYTAWVLAAAFVFECGHSSFRRWYYLVTCHMSRGRA